MAGSLRMQTLPGMIKRSLVGALAVPVLLSVAQAAVPDAQAPAQPAIVSPSPAAPASPAAGAPVASARALPRYFVVEMVVEGNTVLPAAVVESVLTPHVGPDKTLADLEGARAQLEKAYQEAGFITVVVDLNADQVADGVVKLQVIEGKVERVKVTGAQYLSPQYVREQVAELREGSVPNFNVVQRQLMGVSRGDDRRVQPIVRPGRTPGTVETELRVSDALPLSGSIELNNRQSPDTKPLRLSATVRYDNLFQRDHSVSLNAMVTPQDTKQSKVLVGSYTLPAGDGATWALFALATDSLVAPVGAANVVGKGSVMGMRYILPLPSVGDMTHSLSLGVDHKHFRERIGEGADSPTTPLLYLPWNVAYNASHQGDSHQDTLAATLVVASRDILRRDVSCAGYDTPQDQFACKNPNADGSFATLRLDWRHTQRLMAKWSGVLRLAGQLSSQPLVSNEQYALGGHETVRGYLESEVTGDRGGMFSAELQSPNAMSGIKGAWLTELQAFAFADGGRVFVSEPLAGVPPHTSLWSVGLGLRLKAGKSLSADAWVASPGKAASSYTRAHHPRLQGRLVWQF
jgi:hemolysin activation/secretion protein